LKTDIFKKSKPLKHRLTVYFLLFACILMGILWLMQSVFLGKYYEFAMQNKAELAMNAMDLLYSSNEDLSYDEFCDALGLTSERADVMFYVEAKDGDFVISSADQAKGGRTFADRVLMIESARIRLAAAQKEGKAEVSFSVGSSIGKTFVYVKNVPGGAGRPDITIYALASLTPIGPAVNIIRSQLLIVTVIALLLSFFIARLIAKHFATPIKGMSEQAKALAGGNYDVVFKGDGVTAEVDELARTLTDTALELKCSNALQKDLMANVSHDLRTPLTMIKSYAEMIRDLSGDIPEKRNEHLGVIIEESDRLSDLVNDVLILSKMQAGVTVMENKVFDIQKAAESVFFTYLVMEQEGFTLSFEKLDGDVLVKGDERRIQRVIANLMSNAVRYSEDDKNVILAISRTAEGRIRCSVKDRGIGIAEEDREKIWHRYEKASQKGHRTQSGSGLGLSIAAEILERHDAHYGVYSIKGEGSEFWFELCEA
jgi:signal transduction histidine kinase